MEYLHAQRLAEFRLAENKVIALRRHLLDGVAVSALCDELGLQPTLFYRWQKELLESSVAAFQPKPRAQRQTQQERIAYPEQKLQRKDEVLAELMADHLALKSLGEL